MILVCQRGGACSDDGEAITCTSWHCAAYGTTMFLLVFRHPRSHRSKAMALRMMYELCLNIIIAIAADTITWNPCGSDLIDAPVLQCMNVQLDIMQWAVCMRSISNAAVSYFLSALNSGTVKNVTSVRSGTRFINVLWCHWIWNAKRMTLICPYTSVDGQQPSKWEVSIPPKVNP